MRSALVALTVSLAACGGGLPLDHADASDIDATTEDVVDASDAGAPDSTSDVCTHTTCGAACVDLGSDSKSCGACGHDCLGGSCVAGACRPFQLAGGLTLASTSLTLAAPYLYWSGGSPNAASLYRIATTGSAVTTLATGLADPPVNVATDGANIYFAVQGVGASAGAIMSLPLDADGGTAPVVLYPAQDGAYAIAVDANNVYWTNRGFSTTPSVNQAPKNGGGPILPLATGAKEAVSIAVDAAFVYWSQDADPGGVYKAPIGGGSVVPLATAKYSNTLALRNGTLYFSDQAIPAIEWLPLDGGGVTSVTTDTMVAIAVGTNVVSFTHDNLPGTVNDISLDAGTVITLASVLHQVYGLAEDSTAIYWTQLDDGTLMKLAR